MNLIKFLSFSAPTLEAVGTILISIVVLRVHMHIATERRIDEVIVKDMRREKSYIILGLVLVIIGYLLEIYLRLN